MNHSKASADHQSQMRHAGGFNCQSAINVSKQIDVIAIQSRPETGTNRVKHKRFRLGVIGLPCLILIDKPID